MMSIEQLIAENHRLQKELDSMRRQGYNDSIVTKQESKHMETFDDISCEEYYADREEFFAWVRDVEQARLDDVNRELRELAAR